jgi:hypothetical protein
MVYVNPAKKFLRTKRKEGSKRKERKSTEIYGAIAYL